MPPAGLRPVRTGTSLVRAESRAREARERGLREGNAGRPAVGARYIRAGLRQLGWTEAGDLPDAQRIHASHQALAARLLMILAVWESEQGSSDSSSKGSAQAPNRDCAPWTGPGVSSRPLTGVSWRSSAATCL